MPVQTATLALHSTYTNHLL